MKARLLLFALVLALLAALPFPTSTEAETICEEAILVWSWEHMDWICSPSSGGGTVCILCWDEMDPTPENKL